MREVGRSLLAAVVVLAATVSAVVAAAGPAAAAGGRVCYAQETGGISGGIGYHVSCVQTYGSPGDSTGGSSGSGSLPPDTCKLKEFLKTSAAIGTFYPAWCEGTSLCMIHDPPTEASPAELTRFGTLEPPAHVIETFCADAFIPDAGGYTLAIGGVQTPRQLLARADDAYGNLRPPPADVHTSPSSPAVVRLATYFWLGAASFREVRGSSADGMVAIATPQSTTWTPGDGGGGIECQRGGVPYSPGAPAECTHTYTRASFAPRPPPMPRATRRTRPPSCAGTRSGTSSSGCR